MAEHNKLDANTERILESMENVRIRSEAQFKEINILLEALLQQYNLSLGSLHGAANSSKETVRQPCQLQEENTTPDSLNIALLASDEIIPSTEPIEEQSVTDEDSVGQLVVTESVKEIRVAVDRGEIFPSIEPNEAHSVTDEASVGRLSRSWGSVKHHQREVQLARIDSESPTEKTPSLYSTIATIPLLEPEDAALFSEWRCTTDPPRPEKRCAGSRSKCRYHTRRNNPTPSPPPKPPDWTHDAVANPPLPPEPPDLRCCRVAGRRFYLTPPYRACHIHSCLGILEQFHAYYYKNSVLQLNSDLEASLAQSSVESYQTLLAYCIVKDKIFRTAVGLLVDDQNYYLSHGGVTTLLKFFEHSDCKGNLVGSACGVLRNTVGVEEIQRQMVIREGGLYPVTCVEA